MIASLEALRERLQTIRRAYRVSGDLDQLLRDVFDVALELLDLAAATVAGGLADPVLADALERHGNRRWFDLFATDLVGIWIEGRTYPREEAFLVLNRHVERILLNGAIFLWDNDGGVQVEVPYWSDWDWISATSVPERTDGLEGQSS